MSIEFQLCALWMSAPSKVIVLIKSNSQRNALNDVWCGFNVNFRRLIMYASFKLGN